MTEKSVKTLNSKLQASIERCVTNEDLESRLVTHNLSLNDEMNTIINRFNEHRNEYQSNLRELEGIIEKKSDKEPVNVMFERIFNTIKQLDSSLKKKADISFVSRELEERACVDDVNTALSTRVTKKQLEEAISSRASIESVNEALYSKATKGMLIESLKDCVTRTELEQSIRNCISNEEFNRSMNTKLDIVDFEQKIEDLPKKMVSKQHFNEIFANFEEKFGKQLKNFEIFKKDIAELQFDELFKKFNYLPEMIDAELSKKLEDFSLQFSRQINDLEAKNSLEIKNFASNLRRDTNKKLSEQTDNIFGKINMYLEDKADNSEVSEALIQAREEIDAVCEMIRTLKEQLSHQMNNKVDYSEFVSQLETKVDIQESMPSKDQIDELRRSVEKRITSVDMETFANQVSEDIFNVKKSLDQKLEAKVNEQSEQDILLRKSLIKRLGNLEESMEGKVNIRDVCVLLDQKANVDDINNSLTVVNDELNRRATNELMDDFMKKQTLINQSLVVENMVGRWVWNTGSKKHSNRVVWDVQLVNTSPDNFLWKSGRSAIVTEIPGLYEISFGFYCEKKPTVQLLVNGQPILSAINNASYVVHHSSGRIGDVSSGNEGNIAGLTLIDFLALPPRARISIVCTSPSNKHIEGFLGLRKL
eukprot:TRINITY_DN3036_c0_g1_i1.p1 TRINITY_DN3036_c0_g1~~TRINITY_DN3036_c0_g1_i1.p1  ORF type:complete len:720 (-),score=232.01 TRINITY_DN3036_c0_g1_i1:457-2400(-)